MSRNRSLNLQRSRHWMARTVAYILLFLFNLWLGGLIWFANILPRPGDVPDISTDGIVVLTGGGARLSTALNLLDPNGGARLLITGVNENTDRAALIRTVPGSEALFDCCVDIDRRAFDTAGNARETANWARENGYRSLTVVTASYHMPRSLAELRRTVGDIELVAYAVFPDNVRLESWWTWRGTRRIIASEYVKYILSLVRTRLA